MPGYTPLTFLFTPESNKEFKSVYIISNDTSNNLWSIYLEENPYLMFINKTIEMLIISLILISLNKFALPLLSQAIYTLNTKEL